MQKIKMAVKNVKEFLEQAISAHKRTLCQLRVLSFRVKVKEEKDTKI